jgi:hypothetical protein
VLMLSVLGTFLATAVVLITIELFTKKN